MPVRSPTSRSVPREPQATSAALVEAARIEFEEVGFEATNSNKIAARAGYAPQTFYRHFADKLEIFLAVYARWVAEEQEALDAARSARKAAREITRHHRASLRLRRSLRQLTLTDDRVRTARAQSRLNQIERLRHRLPHLTDVPLHRLARSLLIIERIADACAEGEFRDLNISEQSAEDQLAATLRQELMLSGRSNKT